MAELSKNVTDVQAHAILMSIAFGGLIPLAGIVSRYYKVLFVLIVVASQRDLERIACVIGICRSLLGCGRDLFY